MHIPNIEQCVDFHGHICGGVAMGYAMASYAMKQLGADRSEELYCIVQFKNCMTDAVQYVTGCTAGKGNLEVHPIGKRALTLVRASTGEGIHVTANFAFPNDVSREEGARIILAADPETFCKAQEVIIEIPQRKPCRYGPCAVCGEEFDLNYGVETNSGILCPDCSKK